MSDEDAVSPTICEPSHALSRLEARCPNVAPSCPAVAVYTPDETRAAAYDALFAEYRTLHDWFGRGGNDVMHRLGDIRRSAIEGPAAVR